MEDGELPEEGELSDEEQETKPDIKSAVLVKTEPAVPATVVPKAELNDFDAFMKKKKEELQQKVKNQLQLAGVKANVIEGSIDKPSCVLPDSLEKSKGPPKYRDLDPIDAKASTNDPTATMLSSWMDRKPKAKENDPPERPADFDPNDEYYGARDQDYRWENETDEGSSGRPASNEFGDRDYRFEDGRPAVNDRRKRRRSGSVSPDPRRGPSRPKRRHRTPSPPPRPKPYIGKPGRRLICKFFREGYCRDTPNCSFSHDAAESFRKPDLCKYYQQGYCRKGISCPFLHGEWPCKAYHKGECSRDEQCRYSHEQLNPFTKHIFDQLMRDEELAASIIIPQHTKRKTLLGSAPPPQPPNQSGPMPGPGPMGPGPMGPMYDGPPQPPMHYDQHPMNQPPQMMEPHPPMPMNQGAFNQMPNGPGPGPGPMGPMMPHPPGMMGSHMPSGPPMGPPAPMPGPPPQAYNPGNQYMPPVSNSPMHPAPAPGCGPMFGNQMHNEHTQMKQEPMYNNHSPSQNSFIKQEVDDPSYNINQMLQKIKAQVQADDVKKEEPEESPASPTMMTHDEPPLAPASIPCNGMPIFKLIPIDNISTPNINLPADLIQLSMNDNKLRSDPRIKKALESQFNAVSNMISNQQPPMAVTPAQVTKPDPRTSSRDPRLRNQPATSVAPEPALSNDHDPMQEMIQMQLQMTAALQSSGSMPATSGNPMLGGQPTVNPMLGQALGIGPSPDIPVYQPPSFPQPVSNWMPTLTVGSLMPNMDATHGIYSMPANILNESPEIGETMSAHKERTSRVSRWNRTSPLYPNNNDSDSSGGFNTSPSQSDKPVSLREKRKNLEYESPLGRSDTNDSAGRYNEVPQIKIRKKSPTGVDI